jgi:hypothetical protein
MISDIGRLIAYMIVMVVLGTLSEIYFGFASLAFKWALQ